MISFTLTKTYPAAPINQEEILRYAGGIADDNTLKLLNKCIDEAQSKLIYKLCYRELPVETIGDLCDFNIFKVRSQNLATNLSNCNRVIVMGATVGVELDRLIAKYSRLSPSRAIMLQAFGTERIESLCDTFCNDIQNTLKITLKPRFSPGYGDLSIVAQKDIFTALDCPKHIGLTLNNSMLMSPTKSITAFMGITNNDI